MFGFVSQKCFFSIYGLAEICIVTGGGTNSPCRLRCNRPSRFAGTSLLSLGVGEVSCGEMEIMRLSVI